MKGGIGPSELLKVDLEALAKSFPAHLVDKLLEQACTLSVGNTIDQRFRHISVLTLGLDVMVGGK